MPTELPISIPAREGPLDGAALVVSTPLPGADFLAQGVVIRHAPLQALAGERGDFDFGDVQPAPVLGRVVEDDPAQQLASCWHAQDVLEAATKVGVQVIHDEMYAPGTAVDALQQVAHEHDEIELAAAFGDRDRAPARFGLDGDEQMGRSGAHVLVVLPQGCPGAHRQRRAAVGQQLSRLLVDAHHGFIAPERPGIQVQQVVHPPHVLLGELAHAPHQPAPRLEAVFFSSRRMVCRLMPAMADCRCAACANRSKVQRLAPAGGAEHAKAVICASTSGPYWRGLPGRCSSCKADCRPPSRYALRARQIAVRPTPSTTMICDSGTRRSKAARMCARLTSRTWRSPLARTSPNIRRSLLDK